MSDMIKASGISAGYSKKTVLEGIDFTVSKGELISLIGPNGAGKSTLLHVVARQLGAMAGTVYISGTDIREIKGKDFSKKAAVLFTARTRHENESCFDVVSAGRYPYTGWFGIPEKADIEIIEQVMRETDCYELRDLLFDNLSDGQKQRVLIARALAQCPEVLILDEPAAFLDLKYQIEMMELLADVAHREDSPVTVFMSVHDLFLANSFSDRVLMVKDGKIYKYGLPQDVMKSEILSGLYDVSREKIEEIMNPGGIYERVGDKKLKIGYTTGTTASLASYGAAMLLLTGEVPDKLSLYTPGGMLVSVSAESSELLEAGKLAVCTVKKRAGDDPDVTDGIKITSSVRLNESGTVNIDGGAGIGRVTKPGLDRSIGEAAINSVPRKMITESVIRAADENGYEGGFDVVISAEDGAVRAKNTMNPYLGIEGGISILGTSGIVEPMSERAVVKTIEVALKQIRSEGAERVILTPGNLGEDFIKKCMDPKLGIRYARISNFIGDAIELCKAGGFKEVMLIGHTGKLIKIAGGAMNTHSSYADGRQEVIGFHAAMCGAPAECIKKIGDQVTTEACVDILKEYNVLEAATQGILDAIQSRLERKAGENMRIGALLLTRKYGVFGVTDKGREMIKEWGGEI